MTLEGFDVFDRRAVPRVREPTVTIQKDAMFSLSQAAYEAMGKPVAVELLYNAKARMIALRSYPRPATHAATQFAPNGGATTIFGEQHLHGNTTLIRAWHESTHRR